MIVQIRSVQGPFDSPVVARLAVTVLTRAEAMGLLPAKETIERLDMDTFRRLVEGIAQAGIGNGLLADLAASSSPNPRQLAVTLQKLAEALDASPTPACEWAGVNGVLGGEVLASLLGISSSSVRRYLSGNRATSRWDRGSPPLPGTGHRRPCGGLPMTSASARWFQRPRKLLDSRSPAQLLDGTWQPEDPGPQRVRDLAAALVSSPAT